MPKFNFASLEEEVVEKKPDKKPHPPTAPPKLTPPKPPRTPIRLPTIEQQEGVGIAIDWNKVAQSSDFKRAVYLAMEGKAWRGTNENLDKALNKKIKVLRDPNFSNVVKELKKRFESGMLKPSQMK